MILEYDTFTVNVAIVVDTKLMIIVHNNYGDRVLYKQRCNWHLERRYPRTVGTMEFHTSHLIQ